MGFSALLTRLRLGRGLSQEELAQESGVAVRTIRNLERGATRPRLATVRALAAGLRLAADERHWLEHATEAGAAQDRPAGRGFLPAPANRLVGRHAELSALARLVPGTPDRMVTVVGPGGVGKSRLALEVAWRLVDSFARVDVIDLGPLRGRDEVLGALASVADPGTPATAAAIAASLGRQNRLLVLDSVEHVPDLGADLATLLDRCPRLRALMTGRTAPSPAGTIYPLEPLPLPEPATVDPAVALASPAVELLVERTRALRPAFALDESTVEAVVAICGRLDGLPLAIELAAGQLGERDVARVAAELAVRTLRTDLVDVPVRHRTLTDAIEWSTALLGDLDRLAFRALGVFRGRVPAEALAAVLRAMPAAATVTMPDHPDEIVSGPLARLAAASLLRLVDADGPITAVDLLDTVREIATDDLTRAGLAETCGHAHAHHMLTVLRAGDQAATDRQFDDVRAAVEFACARVPDLLDQSVVGALADHLTARGRLAEAHRVLAAIGIATTDPDVAGAAWLRAGVAANQHGDHPSALSCAQAAERHGGSGVVAPARNLAGTAHKSMGELDLAEQAFRSCLSAAEASGQTRYVTVALNNLGTVAHDRGDLATARAHYQRSLEIKSEVGDERGVAAALVNLGGVDLDGLRPGPAVALLTQALHRFRAIGEPHPVVFALAQLSGAHLAAGERAAASQCADEAIRLAGGIDNGPVRAMACRAGGDLARDDGDMDTAAAHYARGLAHGPEPLERAQMLERLAVATRDSAAARAATHAAEAKRIRERYGYPVLPIDEPILAHLADLLR